MLLRRSELSHPRQGERKYTRNNQGSEDNMQLFNTKSLQLQLFEEVGYMRWLQKTQRFTDMLIKFEIGIDNNTKQLEFINTIYMW